MKKKKDPQRTVVWVAALFGYAFGFKGGVITKGPAGYLYKDFSLVCRPIHRPKERPKVLLKNLSLVKGLNVLDQHGFAFREGVKPKLVAVAKELGISPRKMLGEKLLEHLWLHWARLQLAFDENTQS